MQGPYLDVTKIHSTWSSIMTPSTCQSCVIRAAGLVTCLLVISGSASLYAQESDRTDGVGVRYRGSSIYDTNHNHLAFCQKSLPGPMTQYSLNRYESGKIETESEKKNKVSPLYYGGQLALGEVCGVGAGFLSAILTAHIFTDRGDLGDIAVVFLGALVGYTVGSAFGVQAAGSQKFDAPFGTTLVGSIVGMAAGIFLYNLSDGSGPLTAAPFICPTLGAMLGFNLFRTEKIAVRIIPHEQYDAFTDELDDFAVIANVQLVSLEF